MSNLSSFSDIKSSLTPRTTFPVAVCEYVDVEYRLLTHQTRSYTWTRVPTDTKCFDILHYIGERHHGMYSTIYIYTSRYYCWHHGLAVQGESRVQANWYVSDTEWYGYVAPRHHDVQAYRGRHHHLIHMYLCIMTWSRCSWRLCWIWMCHRTYSDSAVAVVSFI